MATLIPTAFSEDDFEKFWKDEDFDRHLPKPGFITDFVMALRGVETPTIFAFWAAVFVMSSLLKRDAYLQWFPENIYPNFYIMLVAPPRVCAKSTSLSFGGKLLQDVHNVLPGALKFKKMPNLMTTRATPESLADALVPEEYKYAEGGTIHTVTRGSELAIIASEASTFLGKQKYNLGLIDRLTHLYDCHDTDQDRTRKTGVQLYKDIYVTFISATTPEGVRSSIPEEAFEGGFMSRLVVVYQDHATRMYPFPIPVGITKKDLVARLGWIAEHAQGGYVLAPEAIAEHERFYTGFHESLQSREDRSERKKNMFHRFDIHLLKLALILRAQRYEAGNIIGLDDYMKAREILDTTLERDNLPVENIGASDHDNHYNRIKGLLQRRPLSRQDLLRAMSPYRCYVEEVNKILDSLLGEASITITLNGKGETTISRNTKEIYTWAAKDA